MALTRRELLKNGALMVALGLTAPSFLTRSATAAPAAGPGARRNGKQVLVVIQLSGGNDGLNTVVPYADDRYYRLRPSLADLPDGDLVHQVDFRAVYAGVLQDWLGADPAPSVGAGIRPLILVG